MYILRQIQKVPFNTHQARQPCTAFVFSLDNPIPASHIEQNSDSNSTQQAKKLQILGKRSTCRLPALRELRAEKPNNERRIAIVEQLQHVEKELHDKAQQQLKINQEYRQQVTEYINSNPPPPPSSSSTNSGKKKRTTSSSSTSSSSSVTSSSSSSAAVAAKHDEPSSFVPLTLPVPSQTIDFFSTSNNDTNSSSTTNLRQANKSNLPASHQHHAKTKKSFHRQLSKFDRRLEQHLHDNQTHLDEMNVHLKTLKLLSPDALPSSETLNSMASPTKIPMRINTDPQKALEHLRELASNPSALERIQTLANNPNLIQEIKKIANQSFIDQLRTLPPFTPANLPSTTNDLSTNSIDAPFTADNHEPSTLNIEPMVHLQNDSTVTQVLPQPTIDDDTHHPAHTQNMTCCPACPSQSVAPALNPPSTSALPHLRFPNRIDVDCETESNHDTALTLSCAGGHEELVALLLQRGANIEHRDKKGFTPLILAGRFIRPTSFSHHVAS